VARRLAGAFASGLPAAKFAASARMMVAALDAEERCVHLASACSLLALHCIALRRV
jgi:hypothetical protein